MSLSGYRKKRSFSKTPEPSGKKTPSSRALQFVVQKHDASHLHYDFRLEMKGVLKSWAVPKGPSTNPEDKRLAMMVEDHPFDYRTFEGIIPEGNYGAGTVEVWDEGTYEPAGEDEKKDKKTQEKYLLQQLHKGHIKFVLHGKKLKGEFALIHIKSRGENAWLLTKIKDKYASSADITKKNKSVQSGKTLKQIAATTKNTWQSKRPAKTKKGKISSEKNKGKKTKLVKDDNDVTIKSFLKKAQRSTFPDFEKPMLASLSTAPFSNPGWLFEIKWDGYRALAYCKKNNIELYSRNNILYNKKYPAIITALKDWNTTAVLDGEIVALNEKDLPDFQQLQTFQKTRKGNLVYYVFDLLWYDNKDTRSLPLAERKEILKSILPENNIIRFSDHFEQFGEAFFNLVVQHGLEGVMAKKMDSEYYSGQRSKQWLKLKNHQRVEAVIAGFTEARGSRKFFGALILGMYKNDELIYVGHTGSGFDEKKLKELHQQLQPLIIDGCPFKKKPKTNMPAVWVKPKLVCEIKFQEWTKDENLRQPIFLGLREDKKAGDVKKEQTILLNALGEKENGKAEKKNNPKTKTHPVKRAKAAARKTAIKKKINSVLLKEDSKEEIITVDKQELKFTNLDKYLWPKEKITKRDLINYYYQAAPYILPYMKDRPQSLNRFPNGITKASFYQKNVKGKVAPWLSTFKYVSESDNETKYFLVCTNEASLLYLANLACIEMNPWHSRTASPDKPDWCVIDLDPGKNKFEKIIETALVVKKVLDVIDVPAYCKTSGSKGIHIYIPLGAKYNYDQSRQFAELIVQQVHRELPDSTSLERHPPKRKGKIYLDYLQNRSIQTIAAPYSVRPRPGATVSAPLHWEELQKGLSIASFTMQNMFERLKNIGDIFKPVLGKGIDINKALKKMSSVFS